ncbi:unnamed protein product [Bursaphelenchus okinawaensis]|uniref:Serpentine receptor class gamma n=1 Tax=Bursaphelenchus okinawaensis TaxID=465554 RepID=A0A811L0B3_9BILA|nr:unnamed protein product [Bursaphelenchus okinawaensis]CAG9114426.1 unnamed protein product [Bursaphelenchus okinawaensis]
MWYEILYGGVFGITSFSVLFNVPLYIIVLCAVVRHGNRAPFNSPFFKIFFALGVVDLMCYSLYLFIKKPIFFGLIPEWAKPFNTPNEYVKLIYPWFYIFGFYQYQLIFLLNLNRFTCLVTPRFYLNYCQHKTTKTCIALLAVLSFIIGFPGFQMQAQISEYTIEIDGINRTMHYGPIMKGDVAPYLSIVWRLHVYTLLFLGLIMYAVMFFVTRRALIKGNGQNRSKNRPEMKLFYMALALFSVNFGFAIYFWLSTKTTSHLNEWILLIMSDIYDLPNGIILWFTCRDIRRVVWKPQNFKFNENLKTITVTPIQRTTSTLSTGYI